MSGATLIHLLGTSSKQYSVMINFSTKTAKTLFHVQNSSGTDILTYAPSKNYLSVVFSTPELAKGSYEVYFGGSHSGTLLDGLYDGGSYTVGTKYTSLNISSITTTVGSGGGPGF